MPRLPSCRRAVKLEGGPERSCLFHTWKKANRGYRRYSARAEACILAKIPFAGFVQMTDVESREGELSERRCGSGSNFGKFWILAREL
jgi:hypothetical protein